MGEYFGDTVRINGSKYKFDTEHLKLSGLSVFPMDILDLKFLKVLELTDGFLVTIPKAISQLENLESLSLKNNLIQDIPTTIGKLRCLSRLDCSNNNLKTIPISIKTLMNLTYLNISGNRIPKQFVESLNLSPDIEILLHDQRSSPDDETGLHCPFDSYTSEPLPLPDETRSVLTRLTGANPATLQPNKRPTEYTVVLIKPGAVKRGLVGEVISRLEKKGLRLANMEMLVPTIKTIRLHYHHLTGKDYFPGIVKSMTCGPLIAQLWCGGNGTIEVVRNMMGDTDPVKALPGTIRGDFGMHIGKNICHSSASVDEALREESLWFKNQRFPTVLNRNVYRL